MFLLLLAFIFLSLIVSTSAVYDCNDITNFINTFKQHSRISVNCDMDWKGVRSHHFIHEKISEYADNIPEVYQFGFKEKENFDRYL